MFIFMLVLCYMSGAVPWSVWLGKLFFHVDPRDQHDRNPGTANAFRAAGWRLGVAVLLLDFCKAAIPVAVAYWLLDFTDQQLFWIALMPSLGHAFSIFLRFRGGRGIVVMFATWAGLTVYRIPLVMGLAGLGATFIVKKDEYRSLAIPLGLIAFLLVTRSPGWMVALAVAQMAVLTVKIGAFFMRQYSQRRVGAVQ